MRVRGKQYTESEIADLIIKGKATESQKAGWLLRELERIKKMPMAKRKELSDWLVAELKRRHIRWN